MYYLIRFIAAIPMLCVGIAAMVAFIGAFRYESLLLTLLSIGLLLGFACLSSLYEDGVDRIYNYYLEHKTSTK